MMREFEARTDGLCLAVYFGRTEFVQKRSSA